ncbi:MAG: nicotinate-nicotinamide nucleotide adenylyltransferase, partial [Clostridia bacterium]|nr:nicotinate-nicotinamide nucleotide adenylyltransferase [Clostridia bacterium]
GTSFTYETLTALSAPDRELYLMMGTDMFLTLDTWRRPDEILRLATVVVASRSFDPVTAEAIAKKREELLSVYKGNIVFLKNRIYDVSSTFLREKIAAGESVSDRLDDDVLKYIEKEKLYDV